LKTETRAGKVCLQFTSTTCEMSTCNLFVLSEKEGHINKQLVLYRFTT